MYDGVIMPHTSGFVVGLLVATIFSPPAAAETTPGRVGSGSETATASVRPETIRLAGRRYVADLSDGGRAQLTLDPRLQQSTENLLRAFQIPFAAAVVVSVPDGRVLAMVGNQPPTRPR
jgi:membrane peptidoglycan carboxypeptidase